MGHAGGGGHGRTTQYDCVNVGRGASSRRTAIIVQKNAKMGAGGAGRGRGMGWVMQEMASMENTMCVKVGRGAGSRGQP